MNKTVIVITGPTASGKTDAALQLAGKLRGEIICMDSMQIYRRMDIGTAKPTLQEQSICPHHMLDVAQPDENYSVAKYAEEAGKLIDSIDVPILVGGTGLYLNAISTDMEFGFTRADTAIREKYEHIAAESGNVYLHELLEKIDPVTAQRLHVNDTRRVIRALQVFQVTGTPFSQQHQTDTYRSKEGYDFRIFAFTRERTLLYERINRRVDVMMEKGLLEQVHSLCESGVPENAQSMQGIGYKELLPVLKGEQPLSDAVELIRQRSRNYAKRQITWFKRDPRVQWISSDSLTPVQASDNILLSLDV